MHHGNNIKSKKGGLFFLPFCFLFLYDVSAFCQSKAVESEYYYTSKELSLEIPDSIKKSIVIPIPNTQIALKMGDIRFTNIFWENRSHTTIFFEAAEGFNFLKESGTAYKDNDYQKSKYIAFENGVVRQEVYYYMPTIIFSGKKETINGYESCLYSFTNPAGIVYNIWISEKLPNSVNPGFYFPDKAGITKIEYRIKNSVWSLDLISYREKDNAVFPVIPVSDKTDTTRNLFPFFDAK